MRLSKRFGECSGCFIIFRWLQINRFVYLMISFHVPAFDVASNVATSCLGMYLTEISGLKAAVTLEFFSADRHILESLLHVGRYRFEIFYIESYDCGIWSFWYMYVSRCVHFEA